MSDAGLKKIEPFEGKSFPFRMSIQKDRVQLVASHWHEHLEIIKVLKGKISSTINGKTIFAEQDDIIFVNSSVLHAVNSESGMHSAILGMVFDRFFLTNTNEGFETKHVYSLFLHSNITNIKFTPSNKLWHELNQCIDSSYDEMKTQEIGYDMVIKSNIYKLAALLLRCYKNEICQKDNPAKLKTELIRFKPVFDYIDGHYSQKILIDELCNIVNLSPFYFTRLFKKMTGKAPVAYINQVRLNAAMKLLIDSNLSITDISEKTGFCNVNYFDKMFKRHMGSSPLGFRNLSDER